MGNIYDKYNMGDIHWQWYSNMPSYYTLVNESLEPFKSAVPGSLIDIGCGDGVSLSLLDQMGFKCSGVDLSKQGIDLAIQHNVTAEYYIQSAEDFALRGLEFDYLYSLNTIEHLDNPECMVEIMKRISKFGVIITDHANGHPTKDSSRYHNQEFTPESFTELFCDFNLEKIKLTDPAYFGFVIKRR